MFLSLLFFIASLTIGSQSVSVNNDSNIDLTTSSISPSVIEPASEVKAEYSSEARTTSSPFAPTFSAFSSSSFGRTTTKSTPNYRPIVSQTQRSIGKFDDQPHNKSANESSLSVSLAKKYREAVIVHTNRIIKDAKCGIPAKKVVCLQDYLQTPTCHYRPPCTIVHSCERTSGCCFQANERCVVKTKELIYLPFWVIQVGSIRIEDIGFINHTECVCSEVFSTKSNDDRFNFSDTLSSRRDYQSL